MRISTQTTNNLLIGSMQNSYGDYASILSKMSTNKNFEKLSENIVDGVDLIKLKNQLSGLEGYQGNIQHAINEMNLAYDTLGSVKDELTSINSLVIQAADATTTPDSAKAISSEINERVETIKDLMNTKYLDTFIFSGANVQQKAYTTDDDGNIIYNGSSEKSGDRNITISENTVFHYNFTGEEIFGKQDGVNDFFAQMKELNALLNADSLDYDSIRAKIGVVSDASNNIGIKNGIVSAKVSKLAATQEINNDTITSLTEKKADIEEVDIIKAASELANANTAMQASYMLGANIMSSVSLLNYI